MHSVTLYEHVHRAHSNDTCTDSAMQCSLRVRQSCMVTQHWWTLVVHVACETCRGIAKKRAILPNAHLEITNWTTGLNSPGQCTPHKYRLFGGKVSMKAQPYAYFWFA
jgi:hypothetical protein